MINNSETIKSYRTLHTKFLTGFVFISINCGILQFKDDRLMYNILFKMIYYIT